MAIMFDADNVPARLAGAIMDEVHRQIPGVAVDRRVYGDFSAPRTEPWKVVAMELGLETRMQASPSRTKNATDIALVIDAMDILHAASDARVEVDTFVIVTNDSDFAPLAQRLRRSGKQVVAVGTGNSLIVSCDAHIPIDFTRVPNRQDPAHVQTLVELCFDLSTGGIDVTSGKAVAAGNGDDDDSSCSSGGSVSSSSSTSSGNSTSTSSSSSSSSSGGGGGSGSSSSGGSGSSSGGGGRGSSSSGGGGGGSALDVPRIEALVAERKALRASADYEAADKLKAELRALGVLVHDAEGTWSAVGKRSGRLIPFSEASWINISDLARHIDRRHPGWRKTHMAEYINFRHMLESEPWSSTFLLRLGPAASYRSAKSQYQPNQAFVQLTAQAHTAESIRRARLERDRREREAAHSAHSGATAAAAADRAAATDAKAKLGSWWRGWFGTSRLAAELKLAVAPASSTASTAPSAEQVASIPSEARSVSAMHDAQFIVDVVRHHASTPEAAADREARGKGPAGKGWLHLSYLAQAIDEAAAKTSKGRSWRMQVQPRSGFSRMLREQPYAMYLELETMRRFGQYDWWVRLDTSKAAAEAAADDTRPEPDS